MNTKDVRVVVTRKMPAAVEAEIAERYDALFNRTDVGVAPEQLVQVLQQADIVITTVTDKWHPGIFDTTGIRTKLLANVGVGVNHIALESARRAGIAVSNTPDVVTDDTADVAIGLMLMIMRRLGEGERHLRSGAWGGLRPTSWCPVSGVLPRRTAQQLGTRAWACRYCNAVARADGSPLGVRNFAKRRA